VVKFSIFIVGKKGQLPEGIVDIVGYIFIILLFFTAFFLSSNHKESVTSSFVNEKVYGISLDYNILNMLRVKENELSLSDKIRKFCKNEFEKKELEEEIETMLKKTVSSSDKVTIEIKTDTCSLYFKKTVINILETEKQKRCKEVYRTQIAIPNEKNTPILLDVKYEMCVVTKK
jgi:hypothetical protein